MPDNNNDDTSWYRRGLDNLGDLADAAADAVQASIDVARSGENPLNAANIANAQNRRRELTDLDRNVDDRIAREWEGQSEAEIGTASGLQRERFTPRPIVTGKQN